MPIAAPDRASLVRAVAQQHLGSRGPLLPVLHDLMEELGHLEPADLTVVADVLNLSAAEVYGVVSFYHDFRTTPPARHTLRLCRGEACQAVGGQELFARTQARDLGPDVEVGEVFCLGNCALGPSGTADGQLRGRLDDGAVEQLTTAWRA